MRLVLMGVAAVGFLEACGGLASDVGGDADASGIDSAVSDGGYESATSASESGAVDSASSVSSGSTSGDMYLVAPVPCGMVGEQCCDDDGSPPCRGTAICSPDRRCVPDQCGFEGKGVHRRELPHLLPRRWRHLRRQ
jgi:hypothetical protein